MYFFEPTEGLEPEIAKQINEYTTRLRVSFEERMHVLAEDNEIMARKLAIYSG